MITTQAYKNQFTGETFDDPCDCLWSEFKHLRDNAVNALHCIVRAREIDQQFDDLWKRLKTLRAKGQEWRAMKQQQDDAARQVKTDATEAVPSNVILLKKAA